MEQKNTWPGLNVIYGKSCRLQKAGLKTLLCCQRISLIKVVETVWQKNNYGHFGVGILANVEFSNSLQSLRWQRKNRSFGKGPKT